MIAAPNFGCGGASASTAVAGSKDDEGPNRREECARRRRAPRSDVRQAHRLAVRTASCNEEEAHVERDRRDLPEEQPREGKGSTWMPQTQAAPKNPAWCAPCRRHPAAGMTTRRGPSRTATTMQSKFVRSTACPMSTHSSPTSKSLRVANWTLGGAGNRARK